jgi:phosphoribosylamine-glycine ligase
MFTGLVESTASVLSLEEKGQSARLLLHSPSLAPQVALGDSIAKAKLAAYTAVKAIRWEGAWCRKDIADKALEWEMSG